MPRRLHLEPPAPDVRPPGWIGERRPRIRTAAGTAGRATTGLAAPWSAAALAEPTWPHPGNGSRRGPAATDGANGVSRIARVSSWRQSAAHSLAHDSAARRIDGPRI